MLATGMDCDEVYCWIPGSMECTVVVLATNLPIVIVVAVQLGLVNVAVVHSVHPAQASEAPLHLDQLVNLLLHRQLGECFTVRQPT